MSALGAPHARCRHWPQPEGIAEMPQVVVDPPAEDGGQRVRVGMRFVGMAYTLLDIAQFLEQVGPESVEPDDVAAAGWVEWRGSGPDAWRH